MDQVIKVLRIVGIANIAKREKNRGAKQLDALMKVSHILFGTSTYTYILQNQLSM